MGVAFLPFKNKKDPETFAPGLFRTCLCHGLSQIERPVRPMIAKRFKYTARLLHDTLIDQLLGQQLLKPRRVFHVNRISEKSRVF